MTVAVPLHPEAVEGAPAEVRWVLPPAALPFVGDVERAPEALEALRRDGTVEAMTVEPTGVRVRLSAGHDWRSEGARVRTAVQAAVAELDGWTPVVAHDDDAVLRAAAAEVLEGEVGAYVRSHGGDLRLIGVEHGIVRVRFSGTCTHCPLSDSTLTGRFETALRTRAPGVVDVVADRVRREGRPFLGIPALRRR